MPAEVEFHTGVADALGFTCRLLRKASRKGARVVVTAAPELLAELDRALWTFEEREFVPHLRVSTATPPTLAARTPVWLAEGELPASAPDVLVNLGAEAPADLQRWRRVIEIVPADPEHAQAGRERWRAYRALGLDIVHHTAAAGARD